MSINARKLLYFIEESAHRYDKWLLAKWNENDVEKKWKCGEKKRKEKCHLKSNKSKSVSCFMLTMHSASILYDWKVIQVDYDAV